MKSKNFITYLICGFFIGYMFTRRSGADSAVTEAAITFMAQNSYRIVAISYMMLAGTGVCLMFLSVVTRDELARNRIQKIFPLFFAGIGFVFLYALLAFLKGWIAF